MLSDSTLQVFEDLNASGAPSARRGFFHILRISNDLRQVRKRGFLSLIGRPFCLPRFQVVVFLNPLNC